MLLLIEVDADSPLEVARAKVQSALGESSGRLVEAIAASDLGEHIFVVELESELEAQTAIESTDLILRLIKEVRLVGKAADQDGQSPRYLVEWDFPEGLTMDAYLARKAEKAPEYEKVPETKFLRTYVTEDMSKCVCLYDAETEHDVRKAREVVDTPVDRLSKIDGER